MDEVWVRLGLIGGALLVAAASTVALRTRSSGKKRAVPETGLQPGIYFFSSSACPDCSRARRVLNDSLGNEGFVEISWEADPGVFHRLDVDAVPATLIVEADGSGTLWPGKAERALESVGP